MTDCCSALNGCVAALGTSLVALAGTIVTMTKLRRFAKLERDVAEIMQEKKV